MVVIKVVYSSNQPIIKVTYDVTNITVSGGDVSPVYVNLDYSASGAASNITSVGLTMPTGFDVANSPLTVSGNLGVTFSTGYSLPTTAKQTEWDTAYNDKINSATVTGTTTKTLTLTQQDGGTVVTSWTDYTTTEARSLVTEVYNRTGSTIAKGSVVYINGAHGNLPTIAKALATGDSTSAQTLGLVQSDITNNNNGIIIIAGKLGNLDTQAYADGAQLYLSATTAGAYTTTKQYAPNHLVYIGIVNRSHPTQGEIEVKIQNGYELDEIHNVSAQNPDDGMIISYVASTQLWTKTNTIDLGTW